MIKLKVLGTIFAVSAMILAGGFIVSNHTFAEDGNSNNTNQEVNSNDNGNVNDSNDNENENVNENKNTNSGDDNDNTNHGDKGKGKGQDGNEIDDEDGLTQPCTNNLVNGHLYKIGADATVYLASHCELKPFRGEAAFKARGLKFQNITTFDSLPTGVTISAKPALPAEGTLVKGSDKTVWFVNHNGKRQGFVSADVFKTLGFSFDQVQQISDSDLGTIDTDTNIADSTKHPDGSVIKCGNSAAVFVVIGGEKFPFANLDAFQMRGHSFDHILNVDCGRFAYVQGPAITK